MARIEAGATGGLVCWRVDRFARNVGPAEADLELIRGKRARIAFADENLDADGPMGEFLLTTLLAMARLQRARLSSGWQTARGRAIARGAFVGKAPVGYRKIRDKNNERVGCLERDPATAPIIEGAYHLAARDGLQAAARYMKRHLPGRWGAFHTRRLLANRVYIGEARHGDDLVNAAAHEPLVTLGTWIAAQVDGVQPRMRSLTYPLSGIARCASCGGPLVGQIGHLRRDGVAPRRYRCSHKWNGNEQCDAPASCLADPLETIVVGQLKDMLLGVTVEVSSGSDVLAQLEGEVAQARADRLEFATDLEIKSSLSAMAFRAGCAVRAEAVEKAEAAYRIEAARSAVSRELPLGDELDDPDQLQRALAAVVERVDVIQGRDLLSDRVHIRWSLVVATA
jgi:hypothetical protein